MSSKKIDSDLTRLTEEQNYLVLVQLAANLKTLGLTTDLNKVLAAIDLI